MIPHCFVIGFNHHHADLSERNTFALSGERQTAIYEQAHHFNLSSLCILHTCNRTEFYGMGDIEAAEALFLSKVNPASPLRSKLIKKQGLNAVEHLFRVAAGLDSQIIGDLEILGQFKNAFQTAKKNNLLNGYFERLVNQCIRASKEIRSKTQISGGTISLSYAVTRFLKDRKATSGGKIVLIGAGQFGTGIARNIRTYLPDNELYISNRTMHKAELLANKLQCHFVDFNMISEKINEFDVIVTAIDQASGYLIKPGDLRRTKATTFFDMSVPGAIDPSVRNMGGVELVTLDDAAALINMTMEGRTSSLPQAIEMIDEHIKEFLQWDRDYQKSHAIRSWRQLLDNMSRECPRLSNLTEEGREVLVGRHMGHFATYVKTRQDLPYETEYVVSHFLNEHKDAIPCSISQNNFHHFSAGCSACPKK